MLTAYDVADCKTLPQSFNFDLERMKAAMESGFVPVPEFDNPEQLLAWIEAQ